ncbi:type III secretion HpaP family protein [Endozoicomonas sp. SCSIO W0465]|uniref:type III secretion HpaP family protein n=1 Tax=Endozoicomonas sp. SCSIO W0465 TaxID=2918516 RepID=UPI0020757244|nr:type III secretion HpaP family protein [Endozoicomonas sp. SCSIO W0465]USE34673.1 type III secretion HpaP family protein [Endozoicomonas sp. SCSIO W0465]
MSTGVNPTGNTQPTPPPQQNNANQQNSKVSEKQANDFADRMTKESRDKAKKTGGDKEQSLESLLAEQNKSSKEAIKGRQEKGSREESGENMFQNARDGSEHAMINNAQNPIKADVQLREIQQANSVKEIDAALQKLADQIQVSAKDAVNGAEVRISLKDNVLPGTEIRIQRHGGELTVTMNTTSAEAGNFLAQHEANLQKMLAERFSNDKVQVNINMSGGDNQNSDGRSRNQYVAEDNDQNSSKNDQA